MRRRRKHLEVSTFPFLAVLLCAMGALILVLLCMDRKSRLAALSREHEKVNDVIRGRQAEYDRLADKGRRDHEGKKRVAKQAWDKKRDALQVRVKTEETALDQELAEVQARLAEAAKQLRGEEAGLDELRKQLEREKALLQRQEQAVVAARRDASGAAKKVSAGDQARARLTAELTRLEKQLAEAVARRDQKAEAYSVVPYRGKRGEERRPVYLECCARGCVFHPGDKALAPGDDLRAELRKRVEIQKEILEEAGVKDKPYVMLLVRPDKVGMARYYEAQSAARDLGLDFGYEFVEADWDFHFPEGITPPQTRVALRPKDVPPPAVPAKKGVPLTTASTASPPPWAVGGAAPRPSGPLIVPAPGIAGQATAPPSGPALGAAPTPRPGGDGPGLLPPLGTSPNSLSLPPMTVGANNPPTPAPSAVAGIGRPVSPRNDDDPMLLPPIGGGGTPAAKTPPATVEVPALLPGTGGAVAKAPPPGPAVATAPKGDARPGSAPSEPGDGARPERTLRPARVGGDGESIVFVECKNDVVIVHPGRRQIAIEALNHSPAHNRLVQAVLKLTQQRQALARPGDAVKVHVRFLVHRDGERTLHLAYPALEPLKLPSLRYSLQAWDNVQQLVTEY